MSKPGLFLAIVLLLALAGSPNRGVTAAPAKPSKGPVDEALASRSPVEFVETPLQGVADSLADRHAINVVLDARALADVGIPADTPITITLRNATLHTALRLMLSQLDLTFRVEDDVLVITTPEEAERRLRAVVYDVDDLLTPPGAQQAYEHGQDELIEAVRTAVAPESWDDVGGYGSIRLFRRALVVSQSDEVHRQIAHVLARLGEALKSKPGETPPPDEFERALEKALTFDFDGVPLTKVRAFLADATSLDVYVDARALDDVGITGDAPVTAKGKNVAARDALKRLLKPLDLAWHRQENVLLITTPEEAEGRLPVRYYNVVDLVTPEDADAGDEASRDYEPLIDLILSTIAPETWDEVGGPGSLGVYRGRLVVSQSEQTHRAIASVLSELRRLERGESPSGHDASEAALREKLRQPATVSFQKTPLARVAESLCREHELPIEVDGPALEAAGLDPDAPVTLRVSRVPLQTVLDLALRPLALTWLVRGDAVLITTVEEAKDSLSIEFYPIRDLVHLDGQSRPTPDDLMEVIRATVAPESWDEVGGPGAIGLYRDLLVVSQTERVQGEIARLLDNLPRCADRAAP